MLLFFPTRNYSSSTLQKQLPFKCSFLSLQLQLETSTGVPFALSLDMRPLLWRESIHLGPTATTVQFTSVDLSTSFLVCGYVATSHNQSKYLKHILGHPPAVFIYTQNPILMRQQRIILHGNSRK